MNINSRVDYTLFAKRLRETSYGTSSPRAKETARAAAVPKDAVTISAEAQEAQKNSPSLRSQMNGVQFEIYNLYLDRQRLNSQIEQTLSEHGIPRNEQENLTFRVAGDNRITVEGASDAQTKARIEAALNESDKRFGARLLSHGELVAEQNGTSINKAAYEKWHVNEFLQTLTGLSLADVGLNEAGEFVGGNDKLDQVIKAAAQPQTDLENSFRNMLEKLKNVLRKGPDTIPDRSAVFGYSGGSLVDLDTKKGFSPKQLADWLEDPFLKRVLLED